MDDDDRLDETLTRLISGPLIAVADENAAFAAVVERAHGRIRKRHVTAAAATMAVVVVIAVTAVVTSERRSAEIRVEGPSTGAVQHDSTTALSATGGDCGPPTTSTYGTGCDGNPTPAQAAALAIEIRQYDQSAVQAMVKEAERNGNHPTNQALVSAFEYQHACRQAFAAAVAAKSAPANRVASVVNGIIGPEITRLRARSTSGSTGYVGFERVAQELIAGQATEVIQSFGHGFCGYGTAAYWKALESRPSG